jgi:hypothetical protein
MSAAANPQSYQNPAWGRNWSNQVWTQPPFWHPASMGRPIIIALVVFLLAAGHIGRMLFWPLAVAGVVFMVASGRWGCRSRWSQWGQQNQAPDGQGPQGGATWQSCIPPWAKWGNNGGGSNGNGDKRPPSGNHAFDEYRAETLRRLEEEQTEFSGFLDRLRFAKDKAEFDQFMAERRSAPRPPTVPEEPAHG